MEKLWTTADVARYFGISEEGVERLAREGTLTGYKLGGRFLRFRPDQVKALKTAVTPIQQAVAANAGPTGASRGQVGWLEQVQDFFYFYDLYLLAGVCVIGLVIYLVSSS